MSTAGSPCLWMGLVTGAEKEFSVPSVVFAHTQVIFFPFLTPLIL